MITAALFLSQVRGRLLWVHLDIPARTGASVNGPIFQRGRRGSAPAVASVFDRSQSLNEERTDDDTRDSIGQLFMIGFLGTSVTAELRSSSRSISRRRHLFSRTLESVGPIANDE